jgi:hypothetical protein
MHADGSRLLEAQPYYSRPLREICAVFDSISMCFTEGAGALSGAMLFGDKPLVNKAVVWGARFGDTATMYTPAWADCKVCWEDAVGCDRFKLWFDRLSKIIGILREDAELSEVVKFMPDVLCTNTAHVYVKGTQETLFSVHDEVMAASRVRIWDRLCGPGHGARFHDSTLGIATKEAPDESWCFFELTLDETNMGLADEIFVDTFTEFGKRLRMRHTKRQQFQSRNRFIRRSGERSPPLTAPTLFSVQDVQGE